MFVYSAMFVYREGLSWACPRPFVPATGLTNILGSWTRGKSNLQNSPLIFLSGSAHSWSYCSPRLLIFCGGFSRGIVFEHGKCPTLRNGGQGWGTLQIFDIENFSRFRPWMVLPLFWAISLQCGEF